MEGDPVGRVSKIWCPIEGCVSLAGHVYMTARHQHLEHCRCYCGWIGASKGQRQHAAQVARRHRDAGTVDPCGVHAIAEIIPGLPFPRPAAPEPPDPNERPEIIL